MVFDESGNLQLTPEEIKGFTKQGFNVRSGRHGMLKPKGGKGRTKEEAETVFSHYTRPVNGKNKPEKLDSEGSSWYKGGVEESAKTTQSSQEQIPDVQPDMSKETIMEEQLKKLLEQVEAMSKRVDAAEAAAKKATDDLTAAIRAGNKPAEPLSLWGWIKESPGKIGMVAGAGLAAGAAAGYMMHGTTQCPVQTFTVSPT